MAFVRADAEAFWPAIDETERWPSVTRVAGWDDRSGAVVAVSVGFESLPGGEVEYFGCVIVIDPAKGAHVRYWSGLDLPAWIDPLGRSAVLDCLIESADSLLPVAAPAAVFRCTRDAHLPKKALAKHHRIGTVFAAHGYEVRSAGRVLGKHSWRATKRRR